MQTLSRLSPYDPAASGEVTQHRADRGR
jgi:hypothetical protein